MTFFAIFIKLIRLGVGFLYSTGYWSWSRNRLQGIGVKEIGSFYLKKKYKVKIKIPQVPSFDSAMRTLCIMSVNVLLNSPLACLCACPPFWIFILWCYFLFPMSIRPSSGTREDRFVKALWRPPPASEMYIFGSRQTWACAAFLSVFFLISDLLGLEVS